MLGSSSRMPCAPQAVKELNNDDDEAVDVVRIKVHIIE
jgi:hypothetical protein